MSSATPHPTPIPSAPLVPLFQGLLIVLEGIDGAGKSTQSRWLASELRRIGYDIVEEHEPTAGPHGQHLRQLVAEGGKRLPVAEEFRLFLLDRHDNQCRTVLPALRRGAIVILDRYYISSMGYQGARGLDPQEIRRANEQIALQPDLLILFDLPPDAGRKRRSGRPVSDNDFEQPEEQRRVSQILGNLTTEDFPSLQKIAADRAPSRVSADLWRCVQESIHRVAANGYGGLDRRFFSTDPEPPVF